MANLRKKSRQRAGDSWQRVKLGVGRGVGPTDSFIHLLSCSGVAICGFHRGRASLLKRVASSCRVLREDPGRSWWQRLFALPFHANFSRAEAQNLTIPRPGRENEAVLSGRTIGSKASHNIGRTTDSRSVPKFNGAFIFATLGSLRENSTYDVLCWATDAVHNDIMLLVCI